jgi:tripartite-type tricarboxylate transporter receptor subunit TctC
MNRFIVPALLALCTAIAPASAQDKYPSRTIKVLVPYAPGGAVDIVARIVTEQMRHTLGQPLVVENKPGAFGIIAMEEMARARPDGYTLMFGNVNTNGITPVLYKKKMSINYEKDITAVARVADVSAFLAATTKDFPPKTFAEFVAYAKANPGKVRYGSVGVGSFPQYDMEILARKAGLDIVHIPNKAGASGMLKDLATGDVHLGFLNLATSASLIRSGQLRPLAIITEERSPDYPDVPTMKELGYPAESFTAGGLIVVAATPPDAVAALEKACVQATAAPEYKAIVERLNATPRYLAGEAFRKLFEEDSVRNADALKRAGIGPRP